MAADCIRVRTLDHSYNVVVFMAAQPSKDGRLGGSPQNSYAGRHPSKRFVQGERRIPSVSNLILPKVGELMVNNQQYDSHDAECFIVDRSTPCLRGVGVKAWSGKEDTTLLSMADCRVKQINCFDSHQIWNKTPDSRVSKGERTHGGSKHSISQKKNVIAYVCSLG